LSVENGADAPQVAQSVNGKRLGVFLRLSQQTLKLHLTVIICVQDHDVANCEKRYFITGQ
jgi:hypothetical protein